MGTRPWTVALLLLMSLLRNSVSGQQINCPIFMEEPRCGEHEIGVNLASWTRLSIDEMRSGAVFSYASGVFYKLHCRKNVLRLSVDGFRSTYEQGARYPDPQRAYGGSYRAGDRTTLESRIGYERRLGNKRLQPYLGIDGGYRVQVDEGVYEGWGDFIFDPVFGTEQVSTHTLFLASFFGLNYRPVKHWSFTMEISASYGWDHIRIDRSERSFLMPDEREYSWNRTERGLLFHPIRTLAVSYHF